VSGSPPVRRRLLGNALRGYRESVGFNLEEAALILGCDRSKVSRIETGERGIRAEELRDLLTEYGVPADEQEALLAVAHRGRESGWWLEYRDVLPPAAQDYVIMELAATEIVCYEANQVPDLLQTPDYMRAVAAADARYTTGPQRTHAIEAKLNRQWIVLGGRSPRLDVVITEGALRQTVGPPRVMREQLGRLAELADTGFAHGLPDAPVAAGDSADISAGPAAAEGVPGGRSSVSLRVLPFAAGAHVAAGCGSMVLLRFAQTPEIGVVHVAALSGGISLEAREEVTRYLRTFAELRAAALPASRSAHLIRAIARSYDR
jgi:transcriptional regulator with XRE-family HTH domain